MIARGGSACTVVTALLLLAAGLGCDDGFDPPPPPPDSPSGPFAVTRDGFWVNGEPTLLLGADVPYYRMHPEQWRDRLSKVRAMGFNVLQTYVPWNFHEPVEGELDFESPDHNLAAYIDLAQELGFKVIIRPGPHIFNEWDGGGQPAWLFPRVAEIIAADGLVVPRDADPDYLVHVERWLDAVNRIVAPRLVTADPPGPVILYQLTNEHDFYALMREVNLFANFSVPPAEAAAEVTAYFEALRDMVLADGIDVQLIMDPTGSTEEDGRILSFTGDVPEYLPAANLYEYLETLASPPEESPANADRVTIEAKVYRRLIEMRDADGLFHGGVYSDYPGFSTETDVSVTGLARHLFGGNDGAVMFNLIGTVTAHPMQMVFLDAAAGISLETLLSPRLSYYPHVVDFRAPVTPSGTLRPTYFELRRLLSFLLAFGPSLATAGLPWRDGPNRNDGGALVLRECIPAESDCAGEGRVELCSDAKIAGEERWRCGLDGVGSADLPEPPPDLAPGSDIEVVDILFDAVQSLVPENPAERTVYYLRAAGGETFLWFLNVHDDPVSVEVSVDGVRFPEHVPLLVPAGEGAGAARHETWGWKIVPVNVPLGAGLPTLAYTTSQVLTLRDVGSRRMLVLYDVAGVEGELRLEGGEPSGAPAPQVLLNDIGATWETDAGGLAVLRYSHEAGGPRSLVIRYGAGDELQIVVTTREEAGYWWFGNDPAGADLAVTDVAWVERVALEGSRTVLHTWRRPGAPETTVYSPGYEDRVDRGRRVPLDAAVPTLTAGVLDAVDLEGPTVSLVEDDLPSERANSFDFVSEASAFTSTTGGPVNLEQPAPGVLRGHAWYATGVDVPNGPMPASAELRIEGAAGIIATYVNGTYVGTVAPAGAPFPARPADPDFTGDALHLPFDPAILDRGNLNALRFRVQVWGHGQAYFPVLTDADALLTEFESTYGKTLPFNVALVLPSIMTYSYRGLWGADDATPDYITSLMPYSDPSEPASSRAELWVDGVPIPLDGSWWITRGEVDGPGGVLDGTGRLLGERLGFAEAGFDPAAFDPTGTFATTFAPASWPLELPDGGTVWLRTWFDAADLPAAEAGAYLPIGLRLAGQSVVVTVWINGQPLGRWISDAALLAQGAPAPAVRDAFLPTAVDRDLLPIPHALLAAGGGRNEIALVIEDCSPPGSADVEVTHLGDPIAVAGVGRLEALGLAVPGDDLRDGSALLYARDRIELKP